VLKLNEILYFICLFSLSGCPRKDKVTPEGEYHTARFHNSL